MSRGDVLHINTHNDDEISPTPEFKSPAKPRLFVMDETPYFDVVRQVLRSGQAEEQARPPLVLIRHANLFFTRILVHVAFPVLYAAALFWNLARSGRDWNVLNSSDLCQLLAVDPVGVALPLVSLAFPLCWIAANYVAVAWVLGVYASSRHLRPMTDDPFDDNMAELRPEQMATTNLTSWWSMKTFFGRALLGTGEYLTRTQNIVHTLGCITALCCTDKKGILSWPNTVPEKIFVVKKVRKQKASVESEEAAAAIVDVADPQDAAGTSYNLVPEILSITHDPRNPFKVRYSSI